MKKQYEKITIDLYTFQEEDVITASNFVDDDETIYPIPGGWVE